nr:L-threonylcarbamoyladenylate synthase [Georgenia sp. H159]
MYDCTVPETRGEGIEAAATALSRGSLVVLPTDTVYGLGAGAFDPEAVAALLAAKGRGRQHPPPVLVPSPATLAGLATEVPAAVHDLVAAFWPGPLTVICRAQPTLAWDLGETGGTVALRMPDDEVALALLTRTGPLAVSSANRHGQPSATTVLEAATALGDRVEVYLDGGPSRGGVASTIIDATGPTLRIVRAGALSREELAAVVPELAEPQGAEADATDTSDRGTPAADGSPGDVGAAGDVERDGADGP